MRCSVRVLLDSQPYAHGFLGVDLQGVSKMRGRPSWVSFPTKARKNLISIYVPKQVIFKVQPPRSPDFSPLDFYPWRRLKSQGIQLKLKIYTSQMHFKCLSNRS